MADTSETNQELLNEISVLKERIKDLEQSESDFRNIFDNCIEGIYRTSPEGRFLKANPSAARLLGYDSPEDLVNSVTDIGTQVYAYPEDRDKAMELLRKNGSFENFEMKCRKKDGSIVWGSLTSRLVRDDQGNVLYIEGTSQDITERKLYDEILRNMAEGACLVRTDEAVIAYANPRFEQMFGYDPGELAGKRISILNAPNIRDPEETAMEITRHLDATGVWSGDVQNIKKDGTVFWCHANVSGFNHPRYGEVWVGVHQDITERKKMEEALRESEALSRALLDLPLDNIVIVTDIKGVVLHFNQNLPKRLGVKADDLAGKCIFDFLSPEVAQLRKAKTEEIIRTGMPVRLEDESHGYWYENVAYPVYGETGKVAKIAVFAYDITSRKKAENALRESEEKYRSLVERAYDAILIADFEGNLLEANKKAEELFGYTREELVGMNILQLDPEDEHERALRIFAKFAEGEIDSLLDAKVLKKDGTTVPVDISGGVIEYGGKQVAQGIFRDITDRKKMEEYLQDYQDRLEKLVDGRTKELRMKSLKLEEVNTALKVLLAQREKDKTELEDKILFNVRKLVLPYLDSLQQRQLDDEQRTYLNVLETNLKNIVSPFAKKLTSIHETFTPQEIKIADLIRGGKTVKEIALAFGVSEATINAHRQHIRNKLGLSNQKVNLKTYLLSLAQ
jgi:PAS domain S-box-containing protein